ncbi:2-phospho-L-lactate guanylyltransferase [uncultured Jatrophihabitans sp.]|uniref:2-phospho-L-lactate guanylyltransferase n=1 Tax=uncultured Jatrophihabitans sp. TaxID=1610747 RepID=UPI0035CB5835
MRWTLLIPAKALPAAKSRLADASSDTAAHARLVEAIRADTVAAAEAVPDVARIVLVHDRPVPVAAHTPDSPERHVFVQRTPGLNAGLDEAARQAHASWPGDGVAVLVADLPALRSAQLAAALAAAAAHPRAFVADAQGTGTTLLTAAPGTALDPLFGEDSARRHAVDAARLVAGAGLRRDVDTPQDLRAAAELGVGAWTAAVLAAARPADAAGGDTVRSTSRGMMHGMNDLCRPEA